MKILRWVEIVILVTCHFVLVNLWYLLDQNKEIVSAVNATFFIVIAKRQLWLAAFLTYLAYKLMP